MSPRRPTLVEPVIVDKFFKNRLRRDVIVVTLSTYEGRSLIDVRQHFMNDQGQNRPTSKGVALTVQRLPDLANAVNKAVRKARELGLLEDKEADA